MIRSAEKGNIYRIFPGSDHVGAGQLIIQQENKIEFSFVEKFQSLVGGNNLQL